MGSKEHELALWNAATAGNLAQVKHILTTRPSVDVNWQDDMWKNTALFRACLHGHVGVVRHLLSDPRVDVNLKNKYGETALNNVCFRGVTRLATELLAHPKIDVNLAHTQGSTPFIHACQQGHTELVRILLEDPRVDVTRTKNQGTSAFLAACDAGYLEIVRMLRADPRIDVTYEVPGGVGGVGAMAAASQSGSLPVLKELLKDPRLDINRSRDDGATPLLIACFRGHRDIVEHLLKTPEVDAFRTFKNGSTMFFAACQGGHLEISRLLLKDPRVETDTRLLDGHRPIAIIVGFDRVEILKHLLASGKKVTLNAEIIVEESVKLDPLSEWLTFLRSVGKPVLTVRDIGEAKNHRRCLDILNEFEQDPAAYRQKLWAEFRMGPELAAELFALVVYHCDDFLAFKDALPPDSGIRKFFTIVRQLPIEMQMLLCNQVYNLPQDMVPARDAEAALKFVNWKYLVSPQRDSRESS